MPDSSPEIPSVAEVFEHLVCPLTRTKLSHDETAKELISEEAGLAFPIIDGVPVLLIERARKF